MLTGLICVALVLVIGVLITADGLRTSAEVPAGQADRRGHDAERATGGARGSAGVHAFPRESVVRENAVIPSPALAGVGYGAGPAEVDSFARPDQTTRAFDQARRDMSQSAASEAALRSRFNAMYLNLSRRSQALVERQLRLIESLEHGEQDRQRLASLSKLNRIAMRMHRNSQNLLVLAGQEPATNWTQPVTLAHLVEAALAEIEDYERVSYEVQPDIALRGPAVHDAVHLLVELMDNATSFSAAEMPVRITGRILTSGGALIDITDRGIGMAAKEMAYANQQLDNPPASDIDVPKWMGLLVVARLAARHGIRVRLNPAELGGLTALVWFPDEILTRYAAPADPGYAAGPRGAVAGSTASAAARMNAPDPTAARADPAWSPRGPQTTVRAEPLTAARRSARAEAVGDPGVVMPQAESPAAMRTLPIFQEVESRWSRGAHEAPGLHPQAGGQPPQAGGLSQAPGLSPQAPGLSPQAGGLASQAGGLPRRPPAPSAGPHAVPGPPSAPPNRPAGRQSWAFPGEEANQGGPDEP